MPQGAVKRFIDLLVKEGLLDKKQAGVFLDLESIQEVSEAVLKARGMSEEELTKVKAKFFRLPYIDLVGQKIPSEVLNVIPKDLAENYNVISYNLNQGNLEVGIVDPTNLKSQEAIEFLARGRGWTVTYSLISPASFKDAVQQYSALGAEVKEVLEVATDKFGKKEAKKKVKEELSVEEVIKTAPISKMVDVILRHAVDARASDIHIEPVMEETRVRYRIDGVLHTTLILPRYLHSSLVSRVKVLANLKIDETRLPQDGRIRQTFDGKDIDFRISTLPLYNNEKVVMRILSAEETPSLEDMGFWSRNLAIMKENIKKPHGMFLVTGPTGSGKSTTLYGVLSILNQEGVNIVTLEDPVEYYLKGVNQSQINPDIGLTFATGLRSILRQDPDIIMVGEIRDNETAELAIHAALTGHIVLSTLHTNDAFGAIPRLIDMEVEPFLIASTVNVIIAQRLVRKICSYCKVSESAPREVQKELLEEIKKMPQESLPKELIKPGELILTHGGGCARCEGTGYSGRTAISEVLAVTDQMKEIIVTGSHIDAIKAEFLRQGLLSLKQDGILKVLQGITTLEEIMTATKE